MEKKDDMVDRATSFPENPYITRSKTRKQGETTEGPEVDLGKQTFAKSFFQFIHEWKEAAGKRGEN